MLRGGGPWWIYAHFKDNDLEFFVLSSKIASESSTSAAIVGTHCQLASNPDWAMTGNPDYAPLEYRDGALRPVVLDKDLRFPDSALHGLAQDLLRRYAQAFSGKRRFLDAVRASGFSPSADLTPVIRGEFEKFSAEP